jgi:hypothetical protein
MLKEDNRLRVFKQRTLRGIIGLNKGKVGAAWRKYFITASYSSASGFKSSRMAAPFQLSHRLPYRTEPLNPTVFLITPRHRPRDSAGTCSRHPATGCIILFIKNLLPL